MEEVSKDVEKVSRGLLQHGVTAYCPTLVTSSRDYYHRVLPFINPTKGGQDGAAILGKRDKKIFLQNSALNQLIIIRSSL